MAAIFPKAHKDFPETITQEQQPERIILWFPMLCVQMYLAFTVLFFAFGPWPWPVSNPFALYSFLILSQIALWLGYIKSLSNRPTKYIGHWTWERLFNFSLVLSLLWIVPNYMNRLGLTAFDLKEIISRVLVGLSNPGRAYALRIKSEALIEYSSLITYLTILVSPFLQMLIPIGIMFWQRLSGWKKSLLLVFAVNDVISWIASGTNKGIADLLFLIPLLVIARKPAIIKRFNMVRMFLVLCVVIIGFYSFFSFFSLGQSSRPGSASITMSDMTIGLNVDQSNPIMRALPENLRGGVAALSNYFTQGYYGLSLCLEEPFVWSFGLGHSYYLPSWFKKIDPEADIALLSYPGRADVDNSWSYFHRWHSIYPWLASDVTFPGTLLLMFFIGGLFAKIWQDILWCKNPIATSLFGVLLIMLFYVPANNQILGFPASAVAFWVLLIWWVRTRRRASRSIVSGVSR